MYNRKGLFINCTQGGLQIEPGGVQKAVVLLNLKVFSVEIPQKEGKFWNSISGRQAMYKSNPGTLILCRKWGASGQEKVQYIK